MPTLLRDIKTVMRRTVEPVIPAQLWLNEFKERVQIIDDNSLDSELAEYMKIAYAQVESDARIAILTQTWQLSLDCFPCDGIELRKTPIGTLNFVKYYLASTLTTLATSAYQTDLLSSPARILPAYGYSWPTHDIRMNAVLVEWTAGYASASVVPMNIKNAVVHAAYHAYKGCELGDNYWSLINRIKPFGWV